MPRRAKGLTAIQVQRLGPGRYGDGAGLYLLVREVRDANGGARNAARFWLFRYTRGGKMREMGLGPASGKTAVPLGMARGKARDLHAMVRDGRDPLAEKREQRAQAAVSDAKRMTFRQCAEAYIAAHSTGWRNAAHRAQWPATLDTYVYPSLGNLAVASVDTALVLKCLQPIWNAKTETAKRTRGRIEAVLDWARVRGYRDGENPARWRGHLDNLLPRPSKVAPVEHHPALPHADTGEFMAALREADGIGARALEFVVLTAARTSEVLGARWSEIDLRSALWTVPASRIKAGREHRVPLSTAAVKILRDMAKLRESDEGDEFVFPGRGHGTPLSNMALTAVLRRMGRDDITVHGFRSTFRDWCAEKTNFERDVAEMALAHAVGDKVEAAYRRGDMFERRRVLMDAWARYCAGRRTRH